MEDRGVIVLYTGPEPTLSALRVVRRLTWEADTPVRLMAIVVVPYTLPLGLPAVPAGFTEQQCRDAATQSAVAARIEVYLCRDPFEVLQGHLAPGSMVIVGTSRRRWWGMRERRLLRWLQEHGHSAVLAMPEREADRRALYRNIVQFRTPNSSH